MHPQPLTKLTPQEYLARERQAETRSEYVDGEVFAMAGASREHNQIAANLVRVLGNQLLEKPCSVYSSDMKVKIEKVTKYTYPDIVIACQTERFEDEKRDVLLNPVIIMEILSDSTEAYDRGRKFLHYQLIESLLDYILISQDSARIEKFSRHNDNTWLYSEFHGLDALVAIESIGCQLRLGDVYHKLDLPAPLP
jgi:Uma2 family endonuclease